MCNVCQPNCAFCVQNQYTMSLSKHLYVYSIASFTFYVMLAYYVRAQFSQSFSLYIINRKHTYTHTAHLSLSLHCNIMLLCCRCCWGCCWLLLSLILWCNINVLYNVVICLYFYLTFFGGICVYLFFFSAVTICAKFNIFLFRFSFSHMYTFYILMC